MADGSPVNRDLQYARAIGEMRSRADDHATRLASVESELRGLSATVHSLDEFLRSVLMAGPLVPATPKPTVQTHALTATKWGAIALGAIGLAAQIAAAFRPDLQGPITALYKMLGGN